MKLEGKRWLIDILSRQSYGYESSKGERIKPNTRLGQCGGEKEEREANCGVERRGVSLFYRVLSPFKTCPLSVEKREKGRERCRQKRRRRHRGRAERYRNRVKKKVSPSILRLSLMAIFFSSSSRRGSTPPTIFYWRYR